MFWVYWLCLSRSGLWCIEFNGYASLSSKTLCIKLIRYATGFVHSDLDSQSMQLARLYSVRTLFYLINWLGFTHSGNFCFMFITYATRFVRLTLIYHGFKWLIFIRSGLLDSSKLWVLRIMDMNIGFFHRSRLFRNIILNIGCIFLGLVLYAFDIHVNKLPLVWTIMHDSLYWSGLLYITDIL